MHQGVKLKYELNDPCWIYIGDVDEHGKPVLIKGFVVNVFNLPHHAAEYYVIELVDPTWMHLEVRDSLLMTSNPDITPPIWSRGMLRKREEHDFEVSKKSEETNAE